MIPQFIEVTLSDGKKYTLEVNKIIGMFDSSKKGYKTYVDLVDSGYLNAKETKQEILDKIDDILHEQFERECSIRERIRNEYRNL